MPGTSSVDHINTSYNIFWNEFKKTDGVRLVLVISTGVKRCAQRLVLVRQVGRSYYYPGDGRIRAWGIGAGTRPYILPDPFNPSTESRDLILFYQSVATLEVTTEVRNTRTF